MGIALPQVVTSDRASGAQVIDGSLKFNGGYLTRTPSSNGNRRTWTYSSWIKFNENAAQSEPLLVAGNSSSDFTQIYTYKSLASDIAIASKTGSSDKVEITSNNLLRDTGWYHIVAVFDSTGSGYQTDSTIYVNGVEISRNTNTFAGGQNYESWVNSTAEPHYLGYLWNGNTFKGEMSQVYLIDGLALGPENFGYTDGLTNTWRPKKYEGTFAPVGDYVISGGSNYLNREPADMFDGSTGTYWQAAASGDRYQLMTFATPKTGTTIELSVLASNGWDGFQINGTVPSSLPSVGSQSWFNITTHTSGSLSSIRIAYTSGAHTQLVYALRIDGTIITGQTQTPSASNSFYLPMDGNSLIGEDKSGKGNNWTPVNFGGSVALPKATGARPILNTDGGGNVARPGVFGSEVGAQYTTTSATNSGGKYVFENEGTQPTFSFIRGATYTFDYNASTGHPLRFATAADAAGSTEYTNGTNTSVSNVISFTVPHNAPNTLYYYCTNHSGMGNSISITTDETKADPYAWKNTLALPLVGSANDVSNSVNSGSTTKTITSNGDPVASNAASNFYGGSFVFDGSGDYLSSSSSADLTFGTGNFTIECWVYQTSAASAEDGIFQISTTSGGLAATQSDTITLQTNGSVYRSYANNTSTPFSTAVITNKWVHLALVRSSTSLNLFVNGVKDATTISDSRNYSGTYLAIGGYYSTSYLWVGNISDFRVYKGVAKYTSNFVVPATSPDILPNTPSGVSGGSKLAKVTDGAVSFDGTGDYLSVTGPGTLAASSNWCMECYFYCTGSAGGTYRIMSADESTDGDAYTQFRIRLGQYQFYTDNAGSGTINTAAFNKWTHIALTKSGTTVRGFVDGRKIWEATDNNSDVFTDLITGWGYGGEYFPGFISNARFVNGSSVYTSEFNPPTRTLTNVTNTKLLCCQSNSEGPQKTAVIPSVTGTAYAMWPVNSDINDDSGNNRTLTANGGSTSFLSADANKFGITNAANFVKDGKYLSYAVTPASAWTIDGYIRLETATTSAPYILGWNGTNGNDTSFGFPSDGSLKFNVFGSFGVLDSGVVAEIGRWYHIRMTTNSTSDLKLFVDGVLVAQQTSSDGDPTSPITFGDVQSGRFSGQVAGVRYTPTDLGAPILGGEVTSNGVTTNSPPVGIKLNGNVSADNFNPFTTDINAVRGQETRYCTLNPLDKSPQTNIVLTNGNLDAANTSSSGQGRVDGTIAFSSGKWYFEGTVTGSSNYHEIGIIKTDQLLAYGIGFYSGGYSYNQAGNKFNSNATVTYGGSYTTGDTIGVAFNLDKGTLVFYKNGVSRGIAYTGLSGEFTFTVGTYSSGANFGWSSNFGQKPFKYAPPEGFQPLNAANVTPETVITRPTNFVDVRSGLQAQYKITDLDFKTDLTIAKSTSNSEYWIWADSVRGFNGGLKSDTTNADGSGLAIANVNGNGYESDSNWFTGSRTYTTYNFKAGGNKNTFNIDDVGYASAAAANMSVGSLNSASYNQTQTWSNNVTTTGNSGNFLAKTAMFDADLTNYTHCNGDGSAAVSVRLTLSPAVQCNSSVSLFGGITSGTSGTITINGTTTFNLTPCATVDPAFSDVTTVPFSGPITSITITKTTVNAAGMILYGWRIDDKLLIDNGVTPTNSPSLAATGASVGTKQGFSIIKYAGSNNSSAKTIPHGLSQKPDFMIIKQLTDSSTAWTIYHSASNVKPNLKYLEFDDGDITDATGPWGDFDPTSSVFTVGSGYNNVNRVSRNFISFHWHNVPGLQKFGSYTGNNDSDAADGPFVELGFRPSLLWIKRLGTGNWIVYDNKRDTINPLNGRLKLNTDGANVDNSGYNLDFLSNGFKITGGNNDNYNAASTYIYCAWAEAPEFNLYGGQSNAR